MSNHVDSSCVLCFRMINWDVGHFQQQLSTIFHSRFGEHHVQSYSNFVEKQERERERNTHIIYIYMDGWITVTISYYIWLRKSNSIILLQYADDALLCCWKINTTTTIQTYHIIYYHQSVSLVSYNNTSLLILATCYTFTFTCFHTIKHSLTVLFNKHKVKNNKVVHFILLLAFLSLNNQWGR